LLAIGDLIRATDPDAARAWYERAQRVDPDSGYPDYALATLLLAAGDQQGARQHAEAAAAKDPNNPTFRSLIERVEAARSQAQG
jgi:tetratricopeptide (TPR) repeat protein